MFVGCVSQSLLAWPSRSKSRSVCTSFSSFLLKEREREREKSSHLVIARAVDRRCLSAAATVLQPACLSLLLSPLRHHLLLLLIRHAVDRAIAASPFLSLPRLCRFFYRCGVLAELPLALLGSIFVKVVVAIRNPIAAVGGGALPLDRPPVHTTDIDGARI